MIERKIDFIVLCLTSLHIIVLSVVVIIVVVVVVVSCDVFPSGQWLG